METAFAARPAQLLGRPTNPIAPDYQAFTTHPLDKSLVLMTADTGDLDPPVVFVVDHDPFLHESLERSGKSNGWQVRRFDCAKAFLESLPILGPSCLVLNVSMPEVDVLELQESIATDRPGMPIILIVAPSCAPLTIQAGSVSMVTMVAHPVEDERVVHAVEKGLERSRPAFSRWAHTALLRRRYESLSNRERQVMTLIVAGRLNKQVGGDLGISEITVKVHRGNTMRKMQAKSFSGLVTMATQLGLNSSSSGAY